MPIQFKDKNILVLGGGLSGNSAAKLLQSQGAWVYLADRMKPEPLPEYYSGFLPDTTPVHEYPCKFDLVIKSPGISPGHAMLQETPYLSEIELARTFYRGKIIGITGTDGKSTTASLVQHFLRACFASELAGNIGTPFSGVCLQQPEFVVLELSSYQLEDSSNLDIDYTAILNLAPDHLERHGSMEKYIQAKNKIIRNARLLVTTAEVLQQLDLKNFTGQILLLGKDALVSKHSIQTSCYTYDTSQFQLQGNHNLQNLAVAILLCQNAGCDPTALQQHISTFSGLKHRFEKITTLGKTTFINDSKSTNLHSLESWLQNYPAEQSLFLLLGGRGKQEDPSRVAAMLEKKNVYLFLYGEIRKEWEVVFKFLGQKLLTFPDLDSIFRELPLLMHENSPDHVVLSPACASFDQYKNFEQRGEHFRKLVLDLSPYK